MPNIKSAKKRVELSKVAYEKNKAEKSALKTTLKKFEAAVNGGDRAVAEGRQGRGSGYRQGTSAQEQCRPEEEQHDSEAEQAGLNALKISPSDSKLGGSFFII